LKYPKSISNPNVVYKQPKPHPEAVKKLIKKTEPKKEDPKLENEWDTAWSNQPLHIDLKSSP